MLGLLSFILSHSFLMPVNMVVLSVFLIPWKYLPLWNAGIIAIWAILLFPWNRPYVDANFDFLADLGIAWINFLLLIAIVALIINRLPKQQNSQHLVEKLRQKLSQKSRTIKLLKIFNSLAYRILAACFVFLLFTDLYHNYPSAWQAHATVFAVAIVPIIFCFLANKHAN